MQASTKEIVPREPRLRLDQTTIQLDVPDVGGAFEADAVNIGSGGLAVRAPLMPEVGTLLRCTFDSPIDGELVEAECEVAWVASSGPNIGEFGLRFVNLAADSVDALASLLRSGDRVLTRSESEALGWDAAPESGPIQVALRLDGVASDVVAEITHDGPDVLVGEQELPFLRLGTAVTTEDGRSGILSAVELRVVDELPRLVLTITFDENPEGAASDELVAGDGVTDPEACVDAFAGEDADPDTIPDDVQPGDLAPAVAPAPAPGPSAFRQIGEPVLDRASGVASAVRDAAEARLEAAVPAVKRGLDAVREGAARSAGRLPEVGHAAAGTVERLRRFGGIFLAKAKKAPESEAPRRRVQGQRPSVAPAAAEVPSRKLRGRHVLVGLVGAAVVVLGAKGVLGAADPPASSPVVPERTQDVVVPAAAPATTTLALPPTTAAPSAAAVTAGSAAGSAPALEPPSPSLQSPEELPPPPPNTRHFGSASVPGAMRFELTMTTPVERIVGETTERGILIHVEGSNSISRAGPIAEQHPGVERASIRNQGENAELRLEWRPGYHPAYRVEAVGNRLRILLGR